jgi:hypothetical protein
MALDAGTVTIAADKSVAGSGLAKVIADSQVALFPTLPGFAPGTRAGIKSFSEGLAAAIVSYLVAHADIRVTIATTDSGLQRTPNPNNPSTATLGPSADKTLSGSLT